MVDKLPDTLAEAKAGTPGETLGYVDFEAHVDTLAHTQGDVHAEALVDTLLDRLAKAETRTLG